MDGLEYKRYPKCTVLPYTVCLEVRSLLHRNGGYKKMVIYLEQASSPPRRKEHSRREAAKHKFPTPWDHTVNNLPHFVRCHVVFSGIMIYHWQAQEYKLCRKISILSSINRSFCFFASPQEDTLKPSMYVPGPSGNSSQCKRCRSGERCWKWHNLGLRIIRSSKHERLMLGLIFELHQLEFDDLDV